MAWRSRHSARGRRRVTPDGARTGLLRKSAGPHRRCFVRLDVPSDERVDASGNDRPGPAGTQRTARVHDGAGATERRRGIREGAVFAVRHALQGGPARRAAVRHGLPASGSFLVRARDGSGRPRGNLRRDPLRAAQCGFRHRGDPRPRVLDRLRRRQRPARRSQLSQGAGARRHRLRRGHVRRHRQPQSRADRDLRLAFTRQAADLLRARKFLLERCAGNAAGRPFHA